ncbi:hypothetical protein [Halorhodospira abdelmalekii]|uniref:hypothetical protein n=1 Tax=Halorhodospira abdelmalekii TaxID=421629 RepID=UPI00190642D5
MAEDRLRERHSGGRDCVARGCLAAALLLFGSLLSPFDSKAQVVVVNDALHTEELSQSTLRAIFTVRLQQLSGERLQVFILEPDHPTHVEFSRNILGVFPYQLRDAWNRATFSGTGSTPTVLTSEAEMLQRIATTPGAIGYISAPTEHPGVRVLSVEDRP